MIIINCKTCKKDFKVLPYRKDIAKFCSRSCSSKNRKDIVKYQFKKGHIPIKPFLKGHIPLAPIKKGERRGKKTEFKKNSIPWNKGIPMPLEQKNKLSELNKKTGNRPPSRKGIRGEACGKVWKGGITLENDKIRTSLEIKLWKKAVMERDNFTCQKTGQRGGKLVVHHIQNFSNFPELRTSIENGITLSQQSHIEFHKIYGKKNNTKEQLLGFLIPIAINALK